MKIAMLCGSPRGGNSTSMYLLEGLKKEIAGHKVIIYSKNNIYELGVNLSTYDILVFAFPLYVDGIPASMMEMLENIKISNKNMSALAVYAIVNNGFYEPQQNHNAIAMLWKWCKLNGFQKGYALGVGAGEMVRVAPLGKGPSRNIGNAIQRLAQDIQTHVVKDDTYLKPNFPRFAYKVAGNFGWMKQAKSNGLKIHDLKRKI